MFLSCGHVAHLLKRSQRSTRTHKKKHHTLLPQPDHKYVDGNYNHNISERCRISGLSKHFRIPELKSGISCKSPVMLLERSTFSVTERNYYRSSISFLIFHNTIERVGCKHFLQFPIE